MVHLRLHFIALSTGTALLTLPLFGQAQQNAERSMALEEIIVTAQKREESLQDTPIALDAFSEAALEREGISNIGDLANNVPALTIEPFPINNTQLRIYIRGIGLIDAQVTQDPPIGVYIDGAYIARSSGLATDIADLQRIEVLRGPQGTLYGRNSTGGAINLITKRPNPEAVEFKQAFTVGNRNLFSSKTSFNIPLTERAAVKAAYFVKEQDGFIDNKGPGGDYGDKEIEGYRLDLTWDMSDRLRLDFAFENTDVNHFNYTYTPIFPSADVDTGDASGDAVQNLIREGARNFYQGVYTMDISDRPDRLDSAVPLVQSDTEIRGLQLTLAYSVSDTLEIKYIYAQRELFDGAAIDLASGPTSDGYRLDNNAIFSFDHTSATGVPVPRSTQYRDTRPELDQEQFSHELQFLGSALDEQLSYITGLYYFEEDGVEDNREVHHQLTGPLGSTGQRVELLTQQHATIENDAWAIFSQLTWNPQIWENRLSLTLGARHSEDGRKSNFFRRSATYVVIPGDGDAQDRDINDIGIKIQDATIDPVGDKKFQDDSFAYIVEFDLSDEINLYAKQTEAYKSGGFNIREPVGGAVGGEASERRFRDGFEAEKVTAQEIGVKAELMDKRLRLNGDVFRSDFRDQQLNFSIPGSLTDTSVANAGSSTLQGVELDMTWLASRNLILILNYAYLDSEIDDAINPLTGATTNQFVFNSAPTHAYTAAIDWTLTENDYGRLAVNATYSYTDERNGGGAKDFAGFDADRQDDFAVLNARLGYYDIPLMDGSLTVAAWGKNLADTVYTVNNIHNLPQAGRASLWGEPRTYGVDLTFNY
jgi:iron complex outermembrane receptor protein